MMVYEKIMTIIINGLEAAFYIPEKNDDIDNIEYFRKLREYLLECITCILHCLKDCNSVSFFDGYVQNVVNFCATIIEDKYDPTLVINFIKIFRNYMPVAWG